MPSISGIGSILEVASSSFMVTFYIFPQSLFPLLRLWFRSRYPRHWTQRTQCHPDVQDTTWPRGVQLQNVFGPRGVWFLNGTCKGRIIHLLSKTNHVMKRIHNHKSNKKTCNNISHVKHHSKSVKKTHCFTKVLPHRRRTHFRRPTCHAGHPRLHLNSEGDCLEGGMVGFILKYGGPKIWAPAVMARYISYKYL